MSGSILLAVALLGDENITDNVLRKIDERFTRLNTLLQTASNASAAPKQQHSAPRQQPPPLQQQQLHNEAQPVAVQPISVAERLRLLSLQRSADLRPAAAVVPSGAPVRAPLHRVEVQSVLEALRQRRASSASALAMSASSLPVDAWTVRFALQTALGARLPVYVHSTVKCCSLQHRSPQTNVTICNLLKLSSAVTCWHRRRM
jgi:hypothetical protein